MKKIWTGWVFALAAAIICLYKMLHDFRIRNLLQIEFSGSRDELFENIKAISEDPTARFPLLEQNTYWDFGFIVAYSLAGFFSLKILLNAFQQKAKKWMFLLVFVPGLLDCIENYHLLKTALSGKAAYSIIYYLAVHIKWAFAIPFYLFIPFVMLLGAVKLIKLLFLKKPDLAI